MSNNRATKSKRGVPLAANNKELKSNTSATTTTTSTTTSTSVGSTRTIIVSSTTALLLAFVAWYVQRYLIETTGASVLDDATVYKNLMLELQLEPNQHQHRFAFVVPAPSETVEDEQQYEDDAINQAANEFNPDNKLAGKAAWSFLSGLATSSTFVQHYWHQRPLLIRAKDVAAVTSRTRGPVSEEEEQSWVTGSFTVERHLRMIENSYITGFRTGESLRNGSDIASWGFEPIESGKETGRSQWKDFQKALDGGTIYFNAAGSLWPNLGALCRLTQYAFGIPTNVNVYATPANVSVSVPPHTDRQDVFVMQTAGTKHWRVYAPVKSTTKNNNSANTAAVDPTDRGKHGDVLTQEELGPPLLDTVLETGDILYVPIGFPHTTDTASWTMDTAGTINNDESVKDNGDSSRTSVHLTMGLDTHVWSLTWADLRSTVLQRSGKDPSWNVNKAQPTKENADTLHWALLQSLPLGVLGGEPWRRSWRRILRRRLSQKRTSGLDLDFRRALIEETKELLVRLEPSRWKGPSKQNEKRGKNSMHRKQEALPSDREIGEAIDFLLGEHLFSILLIQQEFFSDIDPHDEKTGINAFLALQKNNAIMERFAEFSKNEAMRNHYVQKYLATEAMMRGIM